MRLSTKMVLVTLGLVIVPLILLAASLFLLNVYRPRALRLSFSQEDTNIMNINAIRRFDKLMQSLTEETEQLGDGELKNPLVLDRLNQRFLGEKAFLAAYEGTECYYNGGDPESHEDVLRYVQDPGVFEDRDKLYFAGLSHPYLIGCMRFGQGNEGGSIYLVCDVSGSLPSVTRIIFLISISALALVGGTILMLGWLRIRFSKPMKELRQAARSISEGNLDYELVPEDDDEFGELIGSFEEMRRRLKDSAQEQLRAEERGRQLIGNVSHDLKTPITAIRGYVEGLRDGVADSPEKREKYLTTIYNKVNELERLVDELHFYSLVDSDRIPYQFVKLEAGKWFEDWSRELSQELEPQGWTLSFENRLPRGTRVAGDPEQLGRALGNIISNSVKYRDPGRSPRLSLQLYPGKDMICLAIQDNGLGISQEDLPHVFERFYRSDASRSSATGGNGIGLSIVKKILEDHGGRVQIESKGGEGTELSLFLPALEEQRHE